MTDLSERTSLIVLAAFVAVAFTCLSLMAMMAAGWRP